MLAIHVITEELVWTYLPSCATASKGTPDHFVKQVFFVYKHDISTLKALCYAFRLPFKFPLVVLLHTM